MLDRQNSISLRQNLYSISRKLKWKNATLKLQFGRISKYSVQLKHLTFKIPSNLTRKSPYKYQCFVFSHGQRHFSEIVTTAFDNNSSNSSITFRIMSKWRYVFSQKNNPTFNTYDVKIWYVLTKKQVHSILHKYKNTSLDTEEVRSGSNWRNILNKMCNISKLQCGNRKTIFCYLYYASWG